jgi:16S rRNA G527 N7-methylase RsmG
LPNQTEAIDNKQHDLSISVFDKSSGDALEQYIYSLNKINKVYDLVSRWQKHSGKLQSDVMNKYIPNS